MLDLGLLCRISSLGRIEVRLGAVVPRTRIGDGGVSGPNGIELGRRLVLGGLERGQLGASVGELGALGCELLVDAGLLGFDRAAHARKLRFGGALRLGGTGLLGLRGIELGLCLSGADIGLGMVVHGLVRRSLGAVGGVAGGLLARQVLGRDARVDIADLFQELVDPRLQLAIAATLLDSLSRRAR